jgi:hypothetical protein
MDGLSLAKPVFATLLMCCIPLWLQPRAPTDTLPGDPGAITVYTVQNMSFGAFSPGTLGGTLVVSNAGSRSVTGDVIGLNFGILFYQAIFDIDAPQGFYHINFKWAQRHPNGKQWRHYVGQNW